MIGLIMSKIMDHGPPTHRENIAGAKTTIKEIVI
jgi:hypothetical protein